VDTMPTLPRSTCARARARGSVPEAEPCHEQHGALDRGDDAHAAAQHLRARVRGFVPEAKPCHEQHGALDRGDVPTLPRSTCARACEGLSRRRYPA